LKGEVKGEVGDEGKVAGAAGDTDGFCRGCWFKDSLPAAGQKSFRGKEGGTETKLRAAIYVRVSTEEQAVHGYSLAEQREACRQRAAELGAVEILLYADEGASGATLDRPGLDALREAVRMGTVNTLVLRDPDRLSRRLAHQLYLSEEFEKAGVQLEFLDFEWKTTPEGRLFYAIKGAIAEYEREKIRERVTRGKLQKARQGGIPVNFDVYGYRYDTETGEVSLYDEEAAIVCKMFQWFISEDIGIAAVANRLNEMQVPTRRRAQCWHRQVVRQMLTNPVFMGEWKYGKTEWHTGLPRPPESVITIPVPPIVDCETWEKAQEKINSIRRLWSKKGRRKYLLSGLLTCDDCGNTMGGSYINWWGKAARRYTCRRSKGASNQGCSPSKAISADILELAVWEQVRVFLWDPSAIAREAVARLPRENDLKEENDKIKKRLNKLEKGRETVLDSMAMGLLELDEKAKCRLVDIKRSEERLKARQEELEHLLAEANDDTIQTDELHDRVVCLLNRLDEIKFEEKRALIRALLSQITISGRPTDGITVTMVIKAEEHRTATFSREILS
jgi:site-specific DNA recombinase